MTRLISPRGNTGASPGYAFATSFGYGQPGSIQAGMLTSLTDPVGDQATFTYHAVGRRTSTVDPNGNASGGVPGDHTWTDAYDNEDRLTSSSAPAPGPGGAALTSTAPCDPVGNRIRTETLFC